MKKIILGVVAASSLLFSGLSNEFKAEAKTSTLKVKSTVDVL